MTLETLQEPLKPEEKKFYFSIVEYGIMNEDFAKKNPDIRIGRIEIWHRDYWYNVDEIQFALPSKMFEALRDALEFKECDYFQFGSVHSEDLEKFVEKKLKVEEKLKK